MKSLTICIDMDDTIEYLSKAWIKWLYHQYGYHVNYEDIDSWDITKFYPHLTIEQICQPLHEPTFWDTVEPMQDAIEIIPKLKADGHKVYICTSTRYDIAPFKFDRCLFEHFPIISFKDIIMCYNKQMIKCDILVDDAPHNIEGDYIGLLMNAPFNANFDTTSCCKVFRVFDWFDCFNKICEIANAE